MQTRSNTLIKVLVAAFAVIVPLVAAAWLIPPDFPMLPRQILLTLWGVGAILAAERILFSGSWNQAIAALGFVQARPRSLWVALLVSIPMWLFIPLYVWVNGEQVVLQPNWLELLIGVILVNGITEEAIHRGFVFGNLRREHTFAAAVTISAAVFAVQHLYLIASVGWAAGLSSVLLAALISFPLAFLFEKGGNSIGAPAIIHTSTNAPVILLALPQDVLNTVLIPHMGVLVISLYLVFAFRGYLRGQTRSAAQPAISKVSG
jgi:membrane protease YdiL (CAAX protease family)